MNQMKVQWFKVCSKTD